MRTVVLVILALTIIPGIACLEITVDREGSYHQPITEKTEYVDKEGSVLVHDQEWGDIATPVDFDSKGSSFSSVSDLLLSLRKTIRKLEISEDEENVIAEALGVDALNIVPPKYYSFSSRSIETAVEYLQKDINLESSVAADLLNILDKCKVDHTLDYITQLTQDDDVRVLILVAATCKDRQNLELFWSIADYKIKPINEFSTQRRAEEYLQKLRSIIFRSMIKEVIPCEKEEKDE